MENSLYPTLWKSIVQDQQMSHGQKMHNGGTFYKPFQEKQVWGEMQTVQALFVGHKADSREVQEQWAVENQVREASPHL